MQRCAFFVIEIVPVVGNLERHHGALRQVGGHVELEPTIFDAGFQGGHAREDTAFRTPAPSHTTLARDATKEARLGQGPAGPGLQGERAGAAKSRREPPL
jgi:hypothetical protein